MGMFSKKSTASHSEINAFLGVGTEYRGKLDFVGTVRIDGRFIGEISTDGDLVLGNEAYVEGTIHVGRLSSCGEIQGDVVVSERATFDKTSKLTGSLTTPKLEVEQGAFLQGNITMSNAAKTPVAPKVVSANFGGPSKAEQSRTREVEEVAADRTGSDGAGL